MPHAIKPVNDGAIIIVTHTGVVTIDELNELASEVRHRIDRYGLRGVLIDALKVQAVPNKADYLDMLRRRSSNPYLEVCLAILFNEVAADLADFASLATQNRGGVAWEFTDSEQAIEWLRTQTGQPG